MPLPPPRAPPSRLQETLLKTEELLEQAASCSLPMAQLDGIDLMLRTLKAYCSRLA